MIKIEKVGGGYLVRATAPHVKEDCRNKKSMKVDAIIEELRARGAHTKDIGDAFYEADPDWVKE